MLAGRPGVHVRGHRGRTAPGAHQEDDRHHHHPRRAGHLRGGAHQGKKVMMSRGVEMVVDVLVYHVVTMVSHSFGDLRCR